jgi:cation diffusion facilitator CzcD-associated flavoprotein CzcO
VNRRARLGSILILVFRYAPAAENLAYLQSVAREEDFYRFIKFRHQIVEAAWTDKEAKWRLKVKDLAGTTEFEDAVDVFLELNGPVR